MIQKRRDSIEIETGSRSNLDPNQKEVHFKNDASIKNKSIDTQDPHTKNEILAASKVP